MGLQIDKNGSFGSSPGEEFGWAGLPPFTQGYIEALFAELNTWATHRVIDDEGRVQLGFRHLAPETLERIVRDCESWKTAFRPIPDREKGFRFWLKRQRGEMVRFPPLTVQLGGDGRVEFE